MVQFQTESEALVEKEKVSKKLSVTAEGLGETCCHPADIEHHTNYFLTPSRFYV